MKGFSYYLGIIVECFLSLGRWLITRIWRRIQNPVKRPTLGLFTKILFSRYVLLRKAPSKMFDRVLNSPLEYPHFVYIVWDQFVTVMWFTDLLLKIWNNTRVWKIWFIVDLNKETSTLIFFIFKNARDLFFFRPTFNARA